jgi:cytochrome P450
MPIPILTICDALGLPMDHVDEISRGADSMVAQVGAGATREEAFQHAENVMQMHRFIRRAIEERRLKPGTDLISQIVHARLDDSDTPQLTDRELMSIATVALAGGVDTTRNGIAFGLHALATRPDLLARLKAPKSRTRRSAASTKKRCVSIRRCRSYRASPGRRPCCVARPSRRGLRDAVLGLGQSR